MMLFPSGLFQDVEGPALCLDSITPFAHKGWRSLVGVIVINGCLSTRPGRAMVSLRIPAHSLTYLNRGPVGKLLLHARQKVLDLVARMHGRIERAVRGRADVLPEPPFLGIGPEGGPRGTPLGPPPPPRQHQPRWGQAGGEASPGRPRERPRRRPAPGRPSRARPGPRPRRGWAGLGRRARTGGAASSGRLRGPSGGTEALEQALLVDPMEAIAHA